MAASTLISPGVRTGILMATFGALMGIATVWLEEQDHLAFGLGLTIGIALLPWLLTLMPASSQLLPQPGGICSLVLGSGVLVGLAGLYSGRSMPLAIGTAIALGAIVVWVGAAMQQPSTRR